MAYNKRIEEGYKNMNSVMKITDINIALNDWMEEKCPYCHELLGEVNKNSWCEDCDMPITSNDFLVKIQAIVMGYDDILTKYKKITEF